MKKQKVSIAKIVAVFLVVAVLTACAWKFLAPVAASTDTYKDTIAFLDSNKTTVLSLAAASTVASIAVSAIKDDTATPVADKLADISGYLLIILCVLYAEKYLLTSVGFVAVAILFPAGCLFCALSMFHKSPDNKFHRIGLKLIVSAVVLTFLVPSSIFVSEKIYNTYENSINDTIAAAEDFSDDTESLQDEDSTVWDTITNTVQNLKERASTLLSRFIESVAVMLVITCVIPLLTALAFIWFIKLVTGLPVSQLRIVNALPAPAKEEEGSEQEE